MAAAGLPRPAAAADAPPSADDYYAIRGLLTAGAGTGGAVEVDPRAIPRATLRRQALLGGTFLPPYLPISAGEITASLLGDQDGDVTSSLAERRVAARLLARYGLGTYGWYAQTCECKRYPVHARLAGRVGITALGLGDLIRDEAGLGAGTGIATDLAPGFTLWAGSWWASVAPRLEGRAIAFGRDVDPSLAYRGWPDATMLPRRGTTRDGDPAWHLSWPRALTGVRLGRWSVSAGLTPLSVGPGLDGGLTASLSAPAYPAVTVRRVAPFAWGGWWRHVAPTHLLLRVGATSRQTIQYEDAHDTRFTREAHPLLTQALVTWNHTPWLRTTVTHAAMAAPRAGKTLWTDWPEVMFPTPGVTWSETSDGPVTDRILTFATEVRFRHAPWPLLPAAAGRVWAEYGGEDINPHDWLPIPQLSVPAAILGAELLDPAWDLALQYSETRHPDVLWYTNSGFTRGFSDDGWVLGLPQGGAAESWLGIVRGRWHDGDDELELQLRRTAWAMCGHLPGVARRTEVTLTWRRFLGISRCDVSVGGVRERVEPAGASAVTADFATARLVFSR